MVTIAELEDGTAQGITSGFASFFFHAATDAPKTVALTTGTTRNAGTLVPIVGGSARLDRATALPATLSGEGIVVVSGTTASRTDAPFTVTLEAIADGGTDAAAAAAAAQAPGGGCCIAAHAESSSGTLFQLGLLVVAACCRRRGRLLLFAALIGACSRAPQADSASRTTALPSGAPRIVSVGGAVTETLFALGAGDRVVGDDTSSVYPAEALKLPHVGYQRTLAAEGILALSPTLVVASAEAGPPAALEQIRSAGVRVEIVSADSSIAGAKERVTRIAGLAGRDPAATLATLDGDVARAAAFVAGTTARPRVLALYARGENTLFVFGKSTPVETMLALAGAENAVSAFSGTKPLTSEAVVQAAPEIILLPSRGLDSVGGVDGLLKLPGLAETPAAKSRRVVTLDDLMLLGFGPRTGKAVLELAEKLHPEAAARKQGP